MRFVTFNSWKNEGDYHARLKLIISGLAALDADVIALQECFVADAVGADTASALGAALEMHESRQPMRLKHRWHEGASVRSRSDLAILSRVAAASVHYAAFPSDPRDGDRGLLWIDLVIGSGRVRCGCAHLTHLNDTAGATVRSRQAAAAVQHLLNGWSGPAVLMGDLNARAKDGSVAAIFQKSALDPTCRAQAEASGDIDHVLLFQGSPRLVFKARFSAMPPDRCYPARGPSDHPAVVGDLNQL
jgi:endonuclease/exonuclease/phosphatase family metal-dependent hydrolase